MPRTTLLAGAACAALVPCAPAAAAAPLTIVYDTDEAVHALAHPPSGRGLSPARGALRQEPGPGGMFTPGDPARFAVAKVSGAELERLSPRAMAALMQARIRQGEHGAQAHLVSVDELGAAYADARPRRAVRGARLPRVSPRWAGARFTRAMRLLDRPSPYGGTWASRVHVYLAPTVHSSIAAGRGPHRNLGRDGKPHLRTWRALMPGLALAGGVHLQMYHARGGARWAFTAGEWRRVPGSFTHLLRRYRGDATRVHFVMSAVGVPAGAPTGCGSAAACTWTLASATSWGRTVLGNGPGVYRIGADAHDWLAQYNARFP